MYPRGTKLALASLLVAALGYVGQARTAGGASGEALVAVATNFSEVAEQLEREFERDTAHRVTLVAGSSGKLYAQIIQGAPFDVLLSADQERPFRLVRQGFAQQTSLFTYAVGQLVLWSANPDLIGRDGRNALHNGRFRRLALANPDLAPYGRAAVQALRSFGLDQLLQQKAVYGENVGQTHAMIATQNSEIGFVALSYVVSPRNTNRGSYWLVPQDCYAPIRQDAVLLDPHKESAVAFIDYLRGEKAAEVIRAHGYLRNE